jgi:predicted DNA-binding transcriptional regulator AlpA
MKPKMRKKKTARKKTAPRQRRQHVTLPNPLPPYLSRRETCSLVGLSYPSIWKLTKRGDFPRPINVAPSGGKVHRWVTTELQDWLSRRPRAESIMRHGPPAEGDRSQAAQR